MQLPLADELRDPPTLRGALIGTFRRLMRLYFRDIERYGEAPAVATRGRVFVSNHSNALLDPVLVMTDAPCEISPVAKSTLWDIPGLKWLLDRAGAVPIIRKKDNPDKDASQNAAVFDKIAGHLAGGGNILIFPEGTSHSDSKLAPLKSGAARMLQAAAERGGVPPTFQAVALEFDAPSDFRSRCLVLWGPVRAFADLPGDGEDKIRAATLQMEADLKELLVEGETHQDRMRIARVAELLATDAGDRTMGGWSGIGRQVELASQTLRSVDATLIARIAQHVDAYYGELERLGLDDTQIAGGPPPPAPAPMSPLRRAALAPLAASGFALYAIPYFLPRWIARKADPDATSTIKFGAAMVVYPLWAAGLVTGSMVLLPPPLSFAAAAIAVTSPFAALRWLDAIYLKKPTPSPDELARLMRLRITARTAIDEARSKLPS
ncbi:MAG: 1-acyl-sn-glycerol-3-phosphate acyltransferase [Myxococcales bacterium]|nr:1-acyl-sn-glycerol-3-phosphate acyltransferase [Myxococcales bacterium]